MSSSIGARAWASSIRVRIIAVVAGLLALSSIGSVLLLRVVLFERLQEEIATSLDREAEEFQLLAGGLDPRTGQPFGNDLTAIFDVYFSREIADEGETLMAYIDGELYESSRAAAVPDLEDFSPAVDYWLSRTEVERGRRDTEAGEAQYVVIPLMGEPNNGVMVIANFPAFEQSEIDSAVQTQLVVQLGTAVLATLLGMALAGRILRPLRSLAETALSISETDLTKRIDIRGRDEASRIAEAFNDMLERLDQAFTTQRQFLDDTSHELRSPLTVIRGHIELLELDETPQERAATIALVTDEIDRMNQIVSDLFLLAKAEQPDFLHLESINLRDLVLSMHRKMTALGKRDWQVQVPPSTRFTGDRHRLTQAMLQLADNAVKHTDDDAAIRLGADVAKGQIRLWLADSGAGIADVDAEHIFTRFRKGTVNVPGGHPNRGGAGLGLSIVSAIAEAHHGSAALVEKPGWGACFQITLRR
ncbi:signal transduction histidine kinase [Arthrobacter pigmenti]|uniref:histidine kinase n=1 Tax=Arthrobacter pigmenti TaxID=271432 RepID=A0A846RLG5_9MICC|nr:HAMP domain-containing sensor histidine kinase [Arthrobacter pigmenti]NJC20947.1 signal transduction histidine kinase [Arthrobacter pigmenti]